VSTFVVYGSEADRIQVREQGAQELMKAHGLEGLSKERAALLQVQLPDGGDKGKLWWTDPRALLREHQQAPEFFGKLADALRARPELALTVHKVTSLAPKAPKAPKPDQPQQKAAAAAPEEPESQSTGEEMRRQRIEKLEKIRAAGIHPWPERFDRTHTLVEAGKLDDGTRPVRVCGRMVLKRVKGGLTFATLQDIHGRMQIALKKDGLHPDPAESAKLFDRFVDLTDLWDFVGVEGHAQRTKTGEPTIWASSWTFLGKTFAPPAGAKYKGTDGEINWRKRYVDLIANEEGRKRFRLRSALVRSIRGFLDAHGFDEVETPILCNQASGATARPFISHHNAMDMEVVLRIAPETYLKRCIVGGYDRVYEFARCFRNEGMDASHLQDFTMLEWYAAYWNYEDNMAFTERMVRHAIQEATGGLVVERGGRKIDFGAPFPRRRIRDLILEGSGVDIDQHETAESLKKAIFAKKVDLENPDAGRGSLIDQLYKRTARPKLVQPTFIVRHPVDLSPLARSSDDDPKTVDRFQLVVDGWEVVNAYSELVDPIDQRKRLEEQQALRGAGDDEAMPLDEDYLAAMEHGMPPISGFGMGIDRFCALIADAPNLRDVVLFPLMKPQGGGDAEAPAGE
jgi:lysyl-tRNA synthetase, class II